RQVMLEEVEQDIRPVRSRRSGFPLRSVAALVLVGVGVAIAWMMGGEEPAPTQTVLNLPEPVASVDVTAGTGAAVLHMPGDSSSALERIAEEQGAESTPDGEMVSAPVAAATRPAPGGEPPPPLPMPGPPRVEVPAVVAAPPVPPAGGTAPASPAPTASTPVRESTPVAAAPAAATPATSSAPASRAPAVEVQAAPRASAEPHG